MSGVVDRGGGVTTVGLCGVDLAGVRWELLVRGLVGEAGSSRPRLGVVEPLVVGESPQSAAGKGCCVEKGAGRSVVPPRVPPPLEICSVGVTGSLLVC